MSTLSTERTRAASSTGSGWAVRAQQACEWVFWCMAINAAWIVFTLAGGIVLGAAPATVAAAHLTRRRLRGEAFPFVRTFAASWRGEFLRANLLLAPLALIGALLLVNGLRFAGLDQLWTPLGIATLVAGAITAVIGAIAVTMYVHYELPLRSYLVTAARFAIHNAAHSLLLAATMVLIVTVSAIIPGLLPFVSAGLWLTATTGLCLAFFISNDKRLDEASDPASPPSRTTP